MTTERGVKSSSVDILGRRTWVLQQLPTAPRGWTAAQVRERMIDGGDDLSLRTVERMLAELLAGSFGVVKVNGKPAAYGLDPQARAASTAGMPRAQMVTMVLAERYLKDLLPSSLRGDLENHFASARKQIEQQSTWREARWAKKIALSGLGFRTVTPTLADGVLEGAYEALFDERTCEVDYKAVGKSVKTRVLHPQGVLVRNGIHTLLATIDGKPPKVLEFHLHRMRTFKVIADRGAVLVPHFDVRQYDMGGGPAVDDGPSTYRAVFFVEIGAPVSPTERPFSADQEIQPHDELRLRVTATVPNTRDFMIFLRGYGSMIEVVEPPALRARMAEDSRKLACLYRE